MLTSFTIREVTVADLPQLAQLFVSSVQTIAPQHYTPDQVRAWSSSPSNEAWFQQFILDPTTFVAESGDRILGFAGVADDGHVTAIYVHGDYPRQGIGSQLLARVIEFAQQQAIARLYAEASEFSRPLFQKFGFDVYDTERVDRNGVFFDRYLMQNNLAKIAH